MSFNFTEIKEFVRVKGNKLNIKVLATSGKEGDSFVVISPSLLVSGYGDSELLAKESFKHNIELFCQDFMLLTAEQKEIQLKKLGFAKEKFKNKNFSKFYVDEKGILQGLETSTIKTSMLEALV